MPARMCSNTRHLAACLLQHLTSRIVSLNCVLRTPCRGHGCDRPCATVATHCGWTSLGEKAQSIEESKESTVEFDSSFCLDGPGDVWKVHEHT